MGLITVHFESFGIRLASLLAGLILVIWPLVFTCSASVDDPRPRSSEDSVRISILSKSLKEIREGSQKEIDITFPDQTRLLNKVNGDTANISKMTVSWRSGKYQVSFDDQDYQHPHRFIVRSAVPNAVFTIQSGSAKRFYPLPLDVSGVNNDLILTIEESKVAYALDSSAAELGPTSPDQAEALHALGLLVLSRMEMAQQIRPHQNFDFCDLTHCQVYAGRKKMNPSHPDFPWIIDAYHEAGMLPFHARCGGRTLGNKIFGKTADRRDGVKDILSQQGLYLCGGNEYEWEKSITARDLAAILFPDNRQTRIERMSLDYDINKATVNIHYGGESISMAPEDFRLRMNRVRGWNFLPGNLYDVSRKQAAGSMTFIFKGKGLGHGAGLCQAGALRLASLGYSRYEILEQYFPDIRFAANPTDTSSVSPDVSYAVFSLKTGRIEQSSHSSFLSRKAPAGSIFKLVVSIYLAVEQPSLFHEHSFHCPQDADVNMPETCWLRKGHGQIGFTEALSKSCNLYFGSLYRHIPRDNFFAFFDRFRTSSGITGSLPETRSSREFARLLTGLDQRVIFSTQDLIKLVQILSLSESNSPGIESIRQIMPFKNRTLLYQALLRTMKDGTGGPPDGHHHPGLNHIWGKTATVSDGTNKPTLYGIFIGGSEEKGIVVIQKNAMGRTAAKSAVAILKD